jgi:ribosomal protein S18 acetylase RimI-like enzyme
MGPTPDLGPARPDEREAAVRLLFRGVPAGEREPRVARALALLQSGDLDPAGLLVERGPGGVLAALVCLPVAGASALVWPPGSVPGREAEAREDRLLRRARDWLRGRGVKLAQALLAADENRLAPPLVRNGFAHVTHLWYLRRDLRLLPGPRAAPAGLRFRPYDPADPEPFRRALVRTYEGTLDCPEVNGVRTVDEILAGHRAQGEFDPGRWWLAYAGDEPVGVLLLAVPPGEGAWEVAYLGVVPQARRRGYGRELLLRGLAQAREAGAAHVTLSVDGRNHSARALYRGAGFEPYDRREVYLALWR